VTVVKKTVTRFARGSKRTRRGRREMSERFLSVDGPFDSPHPELNDGGGREGTAIGIDVKYAQGDDDAGIRLMRLVRESKTILGLITCQHM
jgi:hypothetical protein